jgi:LAS superfamily LD-carboxypeptidase LdcB
MAAWRNAFRKHFRATKNERARLRGGEYGDEAVEMMVKIMRKFKAAPGFSKHTNGTAVDFMTIDNKVILTTDSDQNEIWKKTWFHKWLVKNADRFKFKPLATEAWHWDYTYQETVTGRRIG